ncbi:MAG: putative fatty-acid--CoA ligase [Phycisphaerales bacterium]|nr:putative fatty-acid--CoA ligase [Phycisphaerales bacterium]
MLLDALLRNAQAAPNHTSVIDDSGSYPARTLAGMAFGIGALLKQKTEKQTVGLLLPAGAAFVAGFYGTLMAGKTPVPINFLLGAKEVGHIIADSGIDTVLTIPFLGGRLDGTGVKIVDMTKLTDQLPPPGPFEPPSPKPDDVATILYTSGTSGLPKGVCLTQNNLQSDVQACIEKAQLKGEHTFLGIIPLFHSTGMLATMLAPVTLGATAVYIARFSPAATLNAIREHNISVLTGVPSMYGALARLKSATPEDFQKVYVCLSGGEPLPAVIREGFKSRFGVRLMEGYGLTETIGPIAFNTPDDYEAGSVGQLIPGAEAKFVDDNDQEVPAGQQGEILFKGPMIMQGYHNLPDETAKAITADGYFRTGDLGHLDKNGFLHITGRKKDVIIVAGEKVYPREVEELLAQHPAIAEAAVVGRKDESRGEAVVAFVVPKEGQEVTLDSVRDFLREHHMVNWKIPKDLHVEKELPRSPTGKVLKRELTARLSAT